MRVGFEATVALVYDESPSRYILTFPHQCSRADSADGILLRFDERALRAPKLRLVR